MPSSSLKLIQHLIGFELFDMPSVVSVSLDVKVWVLGDDFERVKWVGPSTMFLAAGSAAIFSYSIVGSPDNVVEKFGFPFYKKARRGTEEIPMSIQFFGRYSIGQHQWD